MSEYWIRENGEVDFADGDIGDYNHEAIVIRDVQSSIIDQCERRFDFPKQYNNYEYVDWDEFVSALEQAYIDEFGEKDGKELQLALKECGVRREEWDVACGRSDARDYAMQKWNWKTYRDGHIDTWFFRPNDLSIIISGIESIAFESGWSDKKLNKMQFTISVFSSRKQFYLTYQQMKNPRARTSQQTSPVVNNLIQYGTGQATKQLRDLEAQDVHPAYKRPGVNMFGDNRLEFKKFLELG